MKLAVLRERRRDRDLAEGRVAGPERVATFATGTPVANSLGEMWVMQSYLRPDLAMAGLYELWPNPDLPAEDPAKWMWSTVVLTTTATDALGHIHDRSPVILSPRISRSLARPGPHRQRRRRRATRVDPRTPPARLRSQHQGRYETRVPGPVL